MQRAAVCAVIYLTAGLTVNLDFNPAPGVFYELEFCANRTGAIAAPGPDAFRALNGGHWTASVRMQGDEGSRWALFNDNVVTLRDVADSSLRQSGLFRYVKTLQSGLAEVGAAGGGGGGGGGAGAGGGGVL